jgi:hypothetical protein
MVLVVCMERRRKNSIYFAILITERTTLTYDDEPSNHTFGALVFTSVSFAVTDSAYSARPLAPSQAEQALMDRRPAPTVLATEESKSPGSVLKQSPRGI